MTPVVVYEPNPIIGTVTSRSVVLTEPRTRNYVGSLIDLTGALVDPTLQLRFCLEAETIGGWQLVAQSEFCGGANISAIVTWSGFARRVRCTLETSRIVSLGMQITH